MYVDIEDWKNGWYGLGLGLAPEEVDKLIALLQMIKTDPEQHFHLSSRFEGDGGVGDVEVYVKAEEQPNNMFFLGKAIGPGEQA